ncbi:MAG: 50S ribosomal protein L1 [Candidatus Levybacteria bacterium]|nr:50S ribosomal protein L1 [Candidatus Levybacteria bacterium]
MGKIRVKTIGDETEEKKSREARSRLSGARSFASQDSARQKEARELAEAKKVKESKEQPFDSAQGKEEAKGKKKTYRKKPSGPTRSKKYQEVVTLVDKAKTYPLSEALVFLPKLKLSQFDETVELHINTTEAGVSGSLTLPHGTGKKMRVIIANPSQDPQGLDALIKKIEAGTIDFDVLIATPDAMPRLAKVAKFLGPRGLMPNPKAGTVSPKPEEIAKKFEAGQVNFKTEAKAPIIHITVGKVSFGGEKLAQNIKAIIDSLQSNKVKNITLKSTMSPGMKIDIGTM